VKRLSAGTLFIPWIARTLFKKMSEGPVGVKDSCLEGWAVECRRKPGAINFEVLYQALQFQPGNIFIARLRATTILVPGTHCR
jgi:hypothetical protein